MIQRNGAMQRIAPVKEVPNRQQGFLRSRPCVGWRCRRCRFRAIVLDLNLRSPDTVAHRLGALVAFAPHYHLFLQARFLTDDWLLAMGGHVNRAILEGLAGGIRRWAINRPALDRDSLL